MVSSTLWSVPWVVSPLLPNRSVLVQVFEQVAASPDLVAPL